MPADQTPPTPRRVIHLTKHHGLGNDFLVAVAPARPLDGGDARRWCHRREGIGADGLIQATPVAGEPRRWRMILWNSDGGRAEISGNGLRCLAQALADHLGADRSAAHQTAADRPAADQQFLIETDAGERAATVLRADGADGRGLDQVRVGMGKAVDGPAPSTRWSELGIELVDQVGADLGNPHLVGFLPDPAEGGPADLAELDMAAIGPVVEADHPSGLNVHLVRVVDRHRIDMTIWERGAGVTRACGSGACAAAWAADRAGRVDGADGVDVVMPGGAARVEVLDGEVVLTGPAVRVGEVVLDG